MGALASPYDPCTPLCTSWPPSIYFSGSVPVSDKGNPSSTSTSHRNYKGIVKHCIFIRRPSEYVNLNVSSKCFGNPSCDQEKEGVVG